jgi:hypothetical protein
MWPLGSHLTIYGGEPSWCGTPMISPVLAGSPSTISRSPTCARITALLGQAFRCSCAHPRGLAGRVQQAYGLGWRDLRLAYAGVQVAELRSLRRGPSWRRAASGPVTASVGCRPARRSVSFSRLRPVRSIACSLAAVMLDGLAEVGVMRVAFYRAGAVDLAAITRCVRAAVGAAGCEWPGPARVRTLPD